MMILSFPGLVSLVLVWVLAVVCAGSAVTSPSSTDVPSNQQKKIDDLIARPAVRSLSRTYANDLSGPVSEPARLKYIMAGLVILLVGYIHTLLGGSMMDDCASEKALVPMFSHEASLLQRLGVSENITAMVDLYALLAEKMRKQDLNYLSLPPVLACFENDPLYHNALCWGRGFYFDDLHDVDESGHLVRVPYPFSRPEILHYVQTTLCLNEPRIALLVPLVWRVGLVVGWLSGLSISQSEDAQAGMVVLSSLVSPLLSGRSQHVQRVASLPCRLRPGRK